jgi:uncharacterized protein (UPF0548 family)
MSATDLTYAAVGATRDPLSTAYPPRGFRALERQVRIGVGSSAFDAALDLVLAWGVQRSSGMRVRVRPPGDSAAITEGDEASIRISLLGPLALTIPARVVYVLREPGRAGFAYGTLLGHPESGEEAFLIEHRDDDSVWFVLRAFSRPASWFWWLGAPVLRYFQALYTRRYLRTFEAKKDKK